VLAENLVVKSFYLAHADVKQIADMVRTLVETRDIFIDEKLNLLIITDTANAVQRAERLIAAQDLAGAEVILHVEVLEVAVNKLLEIGIRSPTSLTVTDPLFESKLLRSDGSTSVLANSRVRVKNKGKARIHIGDRVPVIATSAAAAGGFVLRSVTYRDVGLTIDVEPLIHAENQVAITVGLQVSNIAREVRSAASGTLTYQIGRRKTVTKLRLRDGETQVLAGLINDEDRRTANRFPGIGEFPVVGRLFSPTRDPTARTEIVLLITPRLLRTVTGPDTHSLEFAAGTEAASGAGGGGAVPGLVPAPPFMPEAPSAVTPAPSAAPPVTEAGSPPELFAPPLPRGVRVPLEDVQP
jgi:general secretion pathway protein D